MQKKNQTPLVNASANFSDLAISFSEDNHSSVFFAHLQNVCKELAEAHPTLKADLKFHKIDRILCDIYLEHQKLEGDFKAVSKGVKDMMGEFSTMLEECKNDKEQLMKSTQDKQNLLSKLKESHAFTERLFEENQMLKLTNSKLAELNSLLSEKQEVLQEQVQNVQNTKVSTEDFLRISSEYDRLLDSNTDMRKDLLEISRQTDILQDLSLPLQIISTALSSKPSLRDELWEQSNRAGFLEKEETLKSRFYAFDFNKMIGMRSEENQEA